MAERKRESDDRIIIRCTAYRTRLLDPDNFSGGLKDVIDGLRKADLIPDDKASDIRLETDQVKVKHKAEERTEIEIEYP